MSADISIVYDQSKCLHEILSRKGRKSRLILVNTEKGVSQADIKHSDADG